MKLTLDNVEEWIDWKLKEFAQKGVDIMKEEVPLGERPIHPLRDSIHMEKLSDTRYFVGTSIEYAKWVNDGRGEVRPKKAKVLHWVSGGQDVFAMRSGPSKPNDFVGRTKKRLEASL